MGALLTAKDLQKTLGISQGMAYNLMHAAAFPSIKLGRRYYVEKGKLAEWLERYSYKTFAL